MSLCASLRSVSVWKLLRRVAEGSRRTNSSARERIRDEERWERRWGRETRQSWWGGVIDLTEEADEDEEDEDEEDEDEEKEDEDEDDQDEDDEEDDFEEGILFPSCGHVGCASFLKAGVKRTYCSDCTKDNTKRAKDAYIKEQTEFVENDVNVLNRIRSEIKSDSLQKLFDEWLRAGKDVIQESNKKRKTTNTYMISSRCS